MIYTVVHGESQAHLPKQERCCTRDSHGIIEGAEVFNNNTTKKGVNVSFMSSVARESLYRSL